jgi:hypothetical protein
MKIPINSIKYDIRKYDFPWYENEFKWYKYNLIIIENGREQILVFNMYQDELDENTQAITFTLDYQTFLKMSYKEFVKLSMNIFIMEVER